MTQRKPQRAEHTRQLPHRTDRSVEGLAARILPSQEALGEGGELAFAVLNEVTLGHEAVELLSLL